VGSRSVPPMSASHLQPLLRVVVVLALAGAALGCTPVPSTPAGDPAGRPPAPVLATPAAGELRVHFLDVGQGDATVVVAPDATMLIDTGRHDSDDVVAALDSLAVAHLDVVAITHPHADHIGQLDEVLVNVTVDEVWMSGTPATTQTFDEAIAAVEASGVAYEEPRAGDTTTVGSLLVEIVHPRQLTGEAHPDSLAMRVTYGSVSFLFTGDAELASEAEMLTRSPEAVAATVYQLGHHGSATSTSPAFLAAVAPEVGVYSAGEDNPYGHPDPDVLARLAGAGVEVYGTNVHGTVTVATDGHTYAVTTARAAEAPPAPPAPTAAPAGADTASCQPGQVDVNSAGVGELERITRIGPSLAEQMVALRPFSGLEDLTRVDGIAEATVEAIRQEELACVS
jgi:competence protein ComEC